MSFPVKISNIAPATEEKTLYDFFSFCGKIGKIDFNNVEPKSATVYFEKVSAARTALMLNGGTLDGSHLTVTSDEIHPDDHHEESPGAGGSGEHAHHIHQEDKPRSGIAAEYLAKGYVLSDSILEKAIEMDKKNGISSRFLTYLKTLDEKLGTKVAGPETTFSAKAINTAKAIDEKQGITTKASTYYERAISSPWGQKVYAFYSTTSKQVLDIHEEARRIAETQKVHHVTPTIPQTSETSPVSAEKAPEEVKTTGL